MVRPDGIARDVVPQVPAVERLRQAAGLAPGTAHQFGQLGARQRHVCSPLARASASSIAAGRNSCVMFAPVLGSEAPAYPPLPCSMPSCLLITAPNRARARSSGLSQSIWRMPVEI